MRGSGTSAVLERHRLCTTAAALSLMAAGVLTHPSVAFAGHAGTPSKGRDTTPPVVSITTPASGATLHGSVNMAGLAIDDVAVASVYVGLDSSGWQAASGTTSWSATVTLSGVAAGGHTLSARATDASGNMATTSISVIISTTPPSPPTVVITSPASGSTANGIVAITGITTGTNSVSLVQVQVDDGPMQTAMGTASWSDSVNTSGLVPGTHIITAWATDVTGQSAVTGVQITVPAAQCSPSTSTTTITGSVFKDMNRDGVFDSGDTPVASINVYFISSGTSYHATTDLSGHFASGAIPSGSYTVELDPSWWPSMRDNWVPDTTGSVEDWVIACASGSPAINFGLRPITRSTNASSPITSFRGPNGVVVDSYDDVVSARYLYDDLMTGTLIGPEAAFETIQFDRSSTTTTSSSCANVNGVYVSCSSLSSIALDAWLTEGDFPVFFEYGNHWNSYYTYLYHNASWNDYYVERGVAGSPLLVTSQAWGPEMLTDDWRQLYASPTGKIPTALNASIPPASQVTGLDTYLKATYRGQ